MFSLLYMTKAWAIGLAVSAPVGPIGMLCIRKTLELGFSGSIAVGLGAAFADSLYGVVAAAGLTAISHFLLEKIVFVKVVGGLLLLYLAYKEIRHEPKRTIDSLDTNTKFGMLTLKTFLLTLSNPITILSFISIFAAIGCQATTNLELFMVAVGLFTGSMTWWLILGTIIIKIKYRLTEVQLSRTRYLSAIILGGFGLFAIFGKF